MNSAERISFDLIRQDQARVHQLVEDLDRRIDLLGRQFETPAPVTPEVHIAPPPLPPRVQPEPKLEPTARPGPIAVEEPKPAPTLPPPSPPAEREPLELRVGTYWMARIGIVILLTGLVFLGNYAYHRIVPMLGPWGKLSLLALAGAALGGVGAWLERFREGMRNFGRVLLAGGAATLYYTAYGAHFVPALQVIESPVVGGGLLLALTGAFIWHADRRRSEALALPAVLLAYYTSAINTIGVFTLFSNLLLTAAAVFLLVRHRWTRLSYASLVATYGSYAFWRFHHLVETGGADSQFGMGLGFLTGYWVLFTVAAFLAVPDTMRAPGRVAFLTANNGALFAFAAQHFAVHRPETFWLFALGFGGVLLGLAVAAVRLRDEERSLSGAYLAQGLALVTLGLAAKLTGPQFAVVLAVESIVLLTRSRGRHPVIFEIGAGLCALGACSVTLVELSVHATSPIALGGPVAAMLLFDAWWVKRLRGEWDRISGRSFAFAALGLVTIAAVIWRAAEPPWQPAFLAAAACASLLAFRGRLPELGLPGQTFLLVGVADFVARSGEIASDPWWSPALLIIACLALLHWWQHQRTVPLADEIHALPELGCASAAVVCGVCWMHAFFQGDQWLVATSIAAMATLVYGLIAQTWALALAGQLFTVIATVSFAGSLFTHHPAWWAALAPVANAALTSLIADRLAGSRFPKLSTDGTWPQIGRMYRLGARALLACWAFEYVETAWRPAFFAALGAGQILAGAATRNPERARCGGIYSAVALATFWLRDSQGVLWADLVAILVIPASLRAARRFSGEMPLLPAARDPLVGAAVATLWLWLTRWTVIHGNPEHLTAAWALLAPAVFAAGLGLRERLYRLGGFAILGLAGGRLFLFDVWRFDTFTRIVSFLVLGGVLLSMSFIYNRFAQALHRWL